MSGKVPPSSRAGKRRKPSARESRNVQLAADLYERFTGHKAGSAMRVTVPDMPREVAVMGVCDGLLYTTVRDGVEEKYIHKFRAKDKPILAVTPDGTQILLIGGSYDWTERGIVDASDYKTRREMRL